MIEQLFENKQYGSYPQNSNFDGFTIEYKPRLFTELPMDRLTNNKVERVKVGSIEQLLDNRGYESNNRNAGFDYYLLMVMNGWLLDNDYII